MPYAMTDEERDAIYDRYIDPDCYFCGQANGHAEGCENIATCDAQGCTLLALAVIEAEDGEPFFVCGTHQETN